MLDSAMPLMIYPVNIDIDRVLDWPLSFNVFALYISLSLSISMPVKSMVKRKQGTILRTKTCICQQTQLYKHVRFTQYLFVELLKYLQQEPKRRSLCQYKAVDKTLGRYTISINRAATTPIVKINATGGEGASQSNFCKGLPMKIFGRMDEKVNWQSCKRTSKKLKRKSNPIG